jgi:hypothetical protein
MSSRPTQNARGIPGGSRSVTRGRPAGIDARAELGHHLAVDFDAAFKNQLLALAPAGNAGRGEHFLQAIAGTVRIGR